MEFEFTGGNYSEGPAGVNAQRIGLDAVNQNAATDTNWHTCSVRYNNGVYSVYVDNFSFRGNSGIPLSNIPFGELKSLGAKENYKLIILSYGLNVVAHDVKNYSWYASSFQKTLNYIKEAFPDASNAGECCLRC